MCIVRYSSSKLWWIAPCFLCLPRKFYFWLCSHSELRAHDSLIQGGSHLNVIVDVLFPNNEILLLVQTVCFQCSLASHFLLPLRKKCCHLSLKSSLFFSSPSSWPSTPAVIIRSRMCWYHLTRFMLINKTQWPWLVRTDLQCLSRKCPQMPRKGASSCRPLP